MGVNSAANFFIYYILRKNFRAATKRALKRFFWSLICRRPPLGSGPARGVGGVGGPGGGAGNGDTPTQTHLRTHSTILSRASTMRTTVSCRNGRSESFLSRSGRSSGCDAVNNGDNVDNNGEAIAMSEQRNESISLLSPHFAARRSSGAASKHLHHHHHHHLHHHMHHTHHCGMVNKSKEEAKSSTRRRRQEIPRSASSGQQLDGLSRGGSGKDSKYLLVATSKSIGNLKHQGKD